VEIILLAVFSYIYGSLPFAYCATALMAGKKLSAEGTGNIGVTNTFKVGGYGAGIISVMGEISKAVVPIFLSRYVVPGSLFVTLLCVYCSLVGTSFSVFLKGRGGKGSTVAIWGLLVLSPYACGILMCLWFVVIKCAKNNPRIKRIPLAFIPVVIFAVERDWLFALFGLLVGMLIFLNNYRREDDFAYYGIFNKKRR